MGEEHLERAQNGSKGWAGKAWRWVGEMEELSLAFEEAGLPGGFHAGAAELYRRLAEFKDVPPGEAPGGVETGRALLAAKVAKL